MGITRFNCFVCLFFKLFVFLNFNFVCCNLVTALRPLNSSSFCIVSKWFTFIYAFQSRPVVAGEEEVAESHEFLPQWYALRLSVTIQLIQLSFTSRFFLPITCPPSTMTLCPSQRQPAALQLWNCCVTCNLLAGMTLWTKIKHLKWSRRQPSVLIYSEMIDVCQMLNAKITELQG